MSFPSEQLTLTIQDQQVVIDYPNAGAWINIEKAKIVLSEGMYADLINSRLKSSLRALDSIDAMAFFENASPTLRKQFAVKNLGELKQTDMQLVITAYREHVAPWLSEWEKALYPAEEGPSA